MRWVACAGCVGMTLFLSESGHQGAIGDPDAPAFPIAPSRPIRPAHAQLA